MRIAVALFLLVPLDALAEVGPPPSCPDGTHREYYQGHRCVKDGNRLQIGPDGDVIEVPDAPTRVDPAVPPAPEVDLDDPPDPPPATEPVAPPPPPPPAVEPVPAPVSSRCATSPTGGSWLLLLFVGLAARRRSKSRSSERT